MKLTLLTIFLGFSALFSQDRNKTKLLYIEPELKIGAIVPNNLHFPKIGVQRVLFLNIGKHHTSSSKRWTSFLNYPSTGISIGYSHFGNYKVFGEAWYLMPYIELGSNYRFLKPYLINIGLGASYFTNPYDEDKNRSNFTIGSKVNWALRLFAYRKIKTTQSHSIKVGVGFLHSSNGHTQLPNYGLNSALASIAIMFGNNKPKVNPKRPYYIGDRVKNRYIIGIRQELGTHEFGNARGPVGGAKERTYTTVLSIGKHLGHNLIVYSGLGYRFYNHYYNYIRDENLEKYNDNPKLNSSNIYLMLGGEVLMGYVGFDLEGGINLWKPFYEEHNDKHDKKSGIRYWIKRSINTRLGIKLYAINTDKNPKNNLFIEASVSANVSQADFSGISLGYRYSF